MIYMRRLNERLVFSYFIFFFNDTATTEIYTLSLHDALPILAKQSEREGLRLEHTVFDRFETALQTIARELRSEEHTSELQSQSNLVCRLLLEKKKHTKQIKPPHLSSTNIVMCRVLLYHDSYY